MKPITELGKPQMVRKALATLGCKRIFIVRDGQEMLDLMREEQIDMVVTEWEMPKINGLELAQYLRRSLDSPNRMIPIIMLTSRHESGDIPIARDAGISEFLRKPFSAKILMERIYAVVEDPRALILSKNFVGPDRRRSSSLSLPPDPDINYAFAQRKPPLVVPREQLHQIILDDTPRMVLPDYTLKKKIGFNVPSELIVNPMTIAKSEDEIASLREEFLHSIMQEVEAMKSNYALLLQSPDHARKLVKAIQDSADSIKSRAGIFGYIRATEVAAQLYNFCRSYYDRENKHHLVIIEKHIQTITVIFAKNVLGDGGPVGTALMHDLAKLIHKYMTRKE